MEDTSKSNFLKLSSIFVEPHAPPTGEHFDCVKPVLLINIFSVLFSLFFFAQDTLFINFMYCYVYGTTPTVDYHVRSSVFKLQLLPVLTATKRSGLRFECQYKCLLVNIKTRTKNPFSLFGIGNPTSAQFSFSIFFPGRGGVEIKRDTCRQSNFLCSHPHNLFRCVVPDCRYGDHPLDLSHGDIAASAAFVQVIDCRMSKKLSNK
jgi:hypothetical protein